MANKIYIFGAGIQGEIFLDALREGGADVVAFIDDFSDKVEWCGLPVLPLERIQDRQVEVYISVGLVSVGIKQKMLKQGYQWVYDFTESIQTYPSIITALKVHSLWYSEDLAKMIDLIKVAQFKSFLVDDVSRKLLDRIVDFRTNFRFESYVLPDHNRQYFPDDIDLFNSIERFRFIDAGAYTGDTLGALFEESRRRKIPVDYCACIEPDQENLRILRLRADDLCHALSEEKIFIYPAAAWHCEENLNFDSGQAASSHVAGTEAVGIDQSVLGLSIDQILFDAKPNYIKIDVEGAEHNVLAGAQRTIQEYRPLLAVCLYHRPSDLWELPLFIHSLLADYEMYLRVYGDMLLETVLYCIPKETN